jgi:hypothetical protein
MNKILMEMQCSKKNGIKPLVVRRGVGLKIAHRKKKV